MSVYSRYVLAQVARPMIATILIALIALLAERTLRVVDLVVGWRGSLVVVVEMLGYLVPHYMGLAIPAAFFLGVLMTFNRLSKDAELPAIYASGVGLMRLLRPLLVAAVALMLLTTALASYLQPWGRYAYRAATWALTNASFYTLLQGGIFTTLGRTTYMVEQLTPDRTGLRRVFLFTQDEAGTRVTVTAETGQVTRSGPASPIELTLGSGVQQVLPAADTAGGGADGPQALVLRFRDFATEFGGGGDAFRPRGEDERELTLPELWRALDQPPPDIDPTEISAEFYARVVRIASLPLLPFMAMPLALGKIRGQRSYGLVVGLGLLIGYHQLLQFGEALVDDGELSAALGIGAPFAAFAAISLALFWRAATRVPNPKGAPWLDRALDRLTGLVARGTKAASAAR